MRMRMFVEAWLPASCALCSLPLAIGEQPRSGICGGCIHTLPGVDARRCRSCAIRLPASITPDHSDADSDALCTRCKRSPPPFERTVVLADFAPPLDRLIHAMKFSGDLAAARALGRLLAARIQLDAPDKLELLVAVPLAPGRLATRGYNQSEQIARALSRALEIPVTRRGLQRTRETAAQSSLALAARSANMQDAFAAAAGFEDRVVGLVDDVMTSGATLQAIAATLKRAGARRVVNLVAARTP
jgi:ComF family protein